jgi:S1-C subfamily serine protease
VPRGVLQCRCGREFPLETLASDAPAGEERTGAPAMLTALLVGALVIGGAGYWLFLRPAPATWQDPAAAEPEEASGTPDTTATQAAVPSGAASAWNAAAKLQEGTSPPDGASITPLAAPTAEPTESIEEMVDRVMPAVVMIETTGGRASGFFVRHDTVITNVHVIGDDDSVTLRRMDGSTVSARVETRAPAFDIAILKVAAASASQTVLTMASAHALRPGQEIIVIGSSFGTLQNSVSRGLVSGLRLSQGVTLVQSDAAASPGNSGGPMLDRSGHVIGVLLGGDHDKPGVNFGVASDHARDILEGRETNLGTGKSRLVNIDTMTPSAQAPKSERSGTQEDQAFVKRVESAEQAARQLDGDWQRFRTNCYKGAISGAFAREWFAVFTPGAMPADAAARCADDFQSMLAKANRFREDMRGTLRDARRASVLPGTIRDRLRQNRLEFDWER